MKILVIGSAGFIGSHTSRFFSADHEVWRADVVEDHSPNYFKLDLENTDFNSLFERAQFDVCINASGNGSVPISLNRPLFDFELNVTNTIKILDAIRIHNDRCKYINMSSAAVYGNPNQLPVSESVELKPLSPYGWHKLYAEQVCREYYYLYNIQTINLRLFSVFGENLRKQLFWETFQKTLRSKKIELFGSGRETRDFIYIADLLNAIECIIDRGLFNGEAVNIASGQETTIAEATEVFCNLIDPTIEVVFNKIVKPGDPLNWRANIDVLKSFGFEQRFSLKDGLQNTAKWLAENK
ncbi:NAD(P)-dependent oxidoreductase [Pedobacter sp. SYP-B3415]|uniref:NAD-dependent epimerase/dehydratase family protein n=1 Tax=Pedobacter sp. SYP-B3415 TaxID=2496641 RepID=UPI00101B79FE|nr:NAD-dependent epimerase/dehydratase family protein [Pedobacter sp. SYP-B3415]